MPTPVIGREGMEFIDDRHLQIAEPGLLIDACRDQHCFDPDLRVRDLFPRRVVVSPYATGRNSIFACSCQLFVATMSRINSRGSNFD